MKKKLVKRTFLSFFIILAIFILYYQFMLNPPLNEDVPLPTELHPLVEQNMNLMVQRAADKGIRVLITDGFRSVEDQDKLFKKGRSEEGNIVTYARGGESYHNFGQAIDFALITKNGNVIWDMEYDGNGNSRSDWYEVVDIAKSLGFEWGGDWENFQDYPHFEMKFDLSIRELRRGKRPPGSTVTRSIAE